MKKQLKDVLIKLSPKKRALFEVLLRDKNVSKELKVETAERALKNEVYDKVHKGYVSQAFYLQTIEKLLTAIESGDTKTLSELNTKYIEVKEKLIEANDEISKFKGERNIWLSTIIAKLNLETRLNDFSKPIKKNIEKLGVKLAEYDTLRTALNAFRVNLANLTVNQKKTEADLKEITKTKVSKGEVDKEIEIKGLGGVVVTKEKNKGKTIYKIFVKDKAVNKLIAVGSGIGALRDELSRGVYTDFIQFDTTYQDGHQEGRLQWNIDDGTLEVGMGGNTVNLQIGQEMLVKVSNGESTTITNGTVVTFVGSQGNRPKAYRCIAGDAVYGHPCGVATEDIISNGYVTTEGLVRDVDTHLLSVGIVYVSGTGQLSNTRPTPPTEPYCVGLCLVSGVGNGLLYVNPQNQKLYTELDARYVNVTGDTMEGDLDFAGYKAIALACDNGSAFPTSPVTGQWFLHTPTGRQYLYQYNGTSWTALFSNATATVYVDLTNGTDSQDKGFGTGADAYKSITYAYAQIPPIYNGAITINVSAGTFTVSQSLSNKMATAGQAITIQGITTNLITFSPTSAVKGTGATQATITVTGAGWTVDVYKGDILYGVSGTNAGVGYAIISNTSDTITIASTFNVLPVGTDVFAVTDWLTKVDNASGTAISASGIRNTVNINDIWMRGNSGSYSVNVTASGTPIVFNRCYITAQQAGCVLANEGGLVQLNYCVIYGNGFAGKTAQARSYIESQYCYIYGNGSGTGTTATVSSGIALQRGTVVDLFASGLSATQNGYYQIQPSLAFGYPRIQNNTTGISVASGGQIPFSVNIQMINNTTNVSETAGSFGNYDGSGLFTRNAGVFVDGTTDIVQARVQGHSTQTNDLQAWENSLGTVLASIENDGSLGTSGTTATMPAYHNETDTNTGLYFPSADTMATSMGGKRNDQLSQDKRILGQDTTAQNSTPTTYEVESSRGVGTGNGNNIDFYEYYGLTTAETSVGVDTPTTTARASASSHTQAHTVSVNNNRILFVQVAYRSNTITSTSVTYGGVSLNLLQRQVQGTVVTQEVWYLIAPTTGSNNVVVTPSSASACKIGIASYYGVSQANPYDTPSYATGTGTTATVTSTLSGSNRLTIDFVLKDNTTEAITNDGSQTPNYLLSSATGGSNIIGSTYKSNGTTMTWTWATTSRNWAMTSIPLIPSANETNQTRRRVFSLLPTGVLIPQSVSNGVRKVMSSTDSILSTDNIVVYAQTCTTTLPQATGSGLTIRLICRTGLLTINATSSTIKGETAQNITAGEDLILSDTESGIWE